MSKNIAKTLFATAQALAKASEDLAKIAKELTPKEPETFSSVALLKKQCKEKKISVDKVDNGINEGILGMPGEKYRKLNGLPKPLNDNLTVSQVQQKMFANVFAVEIISEDLRSHIPAGEAKPIGLRAGTLARVLKEDCDVRKLLNTRADALLNMHSSKSVLAEADTKIRRKIR